MTEQEAIALAGTGWWKGREPWEVAMFQMTERLLCMPFDDFHEALEKALGRPVFTHEIALDHAGIVAELRGDRPAPSFEEILALIVADKRDQGEGTDG